MQAWSGLPSGQRPSLNEPEKVQLTSQVAQGPTSSLGQVRADKSGSVIGGVVVVISVALPGG
jgi:hypothetical protein